MFASPTNAAAQSNNTRAKGDFEPALGFINVYLPSNDGGKAKLGSLPLKGSKSREKALFDALMKNPEAVLAAIQDKLQFDFQSAEQSEAKGFDIGITL